jgi:CRP/FNR family cyclic AMP-dependent transcriptional regulator
MGDIFERILMLKDTPFFSAVNTDDLHVVAQEIQEEAYLSGDRVFDIYDPSDRVYIIRSGKVGISIGEDPASKEFITILGERECFGEMGVLDDEPRSATVHVIEDAVLLVLEKSKLRGLIATYPELSLGIMRSLTGRLREANRRLA